MDRVGYSLEFPDNFGNMTSLKSFIFTPMISLPAANEVTLPKSFAKLKALESLTIRNSGYVEFNGTLGSLTSLKMVSL